MPVLKNDSGAIRFVRQRAARRKGLRAVLATLMACFPIVAICALAGLATRATSQQPPSAASLTIPAPARRHVPAQGPAVPTPTHPLSAADLEAWRDGMLPAALEQGKVGGVVVSVVKDGHLLLAKGYGYADVAAKTRMDPNVTLVRPGSTSKLFTWTAVMQLVEQGKLDLNADVNRYLDSRSPNRSGARSRSTT